MRTPLYSWGTKFLILKPSSGLNKYAHQIWLLYIKSFGHLWRRNKLFPIIYFIHNIIIMFYIIYCTDISRKLIVIVTWILNSIQILYCYISSLFYESISPSETGILIYSWLKIKLFLHYECLDRLFVRESQN